MVDRRLRVLLVDDDEDEFILTGDLLAGAEDTNFELEWAENFEAGLEALARGRHDVYLVDHYLGARDGLEFLAEASKLGYRVPVIVLTGQSNQRLDLAAIHAGAADYLVKGQIDARLLERSIRHALERSRALEALRTSEERYRAVLEALDEGVVMQNQDGQILACNPAAERILGLSADQMMGRSSLDRRWRATREDGTDFPGEEHPAMQTLRHGLPQTGVVMGVHKPDGGLTWVSINTRPLFHPGMTLPHAVVVSFSDITERRRAEDRFRHTSSTIP